MDGYYEFNDDRIALEFLGCFWHGCKCRFNPNKLNPVSKLPFGLLKRQSDNKLNVLRDTYNLKVISKLLFGNACGRKPNKSILMLWLL